jgi:hypothetical protein
MKLVAFSFFIFFHIYGFGQDKFVGRYNWLMLLSDTLENPPPNYLYPKSFIIKSDFTYTYTEEEDSSPYEKPMKESINGSWKFSEDTIIFFNKNYIKPKGYKYNYFPDQKFKGIKLVVKDSKLKPIEIDWCSLDSIGIGTQREYSDVPYRLPLKNEIILKDTVYSSIKFTPKGFCKEFRDCYFTLGLDGIKSGTLIELIVYSREMEIMFDNKRFILKKNILHEVSTECYLPDTWTNNFIKIK